MITIRPYQTVDWPILCRIHDAARLDELGLSVGTDAFIPLEDAAENEGLFDYTVCIAEMDGDPTGFVAFNHAELGWLYVDPAFYRQGVGRALVRHAIANAGPSMQIELLEGNTPAQTLYLSEGFSVTNRVEGNLVGNESFKVTGLVLKRELIPAAV